MSFQNNFLSNIPPVTKILLFMNVGLFLICLIIPESISSMLAVYPIQSQEFRPFQIITHMFMHGGGFHLFFNMFALFMFGAVLERLWGQQRFLIYYFVCGLGAAAINMLVQYIRIKHAIAEMEALPMYGIAAVQDVFSKGAEIMKDGYNYKDEILANLNVMLNTRTVGASGAVYGLLLAFAINFPNTPLYIMFIPIPIKAKWLIIGFFVIELGLGILDRAGDNIAHFAHLGGMLFGLFFILIWKRKQFNRWN